MNKTPWSHVSRTGLVALVALGLLAAMPRSAGWAASAGKRSGVAAASTATQTPLPLGGVDISGRWSVTRTWWRRCSRCGGGSVIRTTPWTIVQTGDQIRVDRGPKGQVLFDSQGALRLNLGGLENEASSVYRFWYNTLRVSPDGQSFEGGFEGSESTLSSCGRDAMPVSCFATAGWLRARRIGPLAPLPTPRRPLLLLGP